MQTVLKLTKYLRDLSCFALSFMLAITLLDVLFRAIWKPIPGTYEMVSMSGAVVLAFSIPLTSWEKGHVYMEFILERLGIKSRRVLLLITGAMSIVLFMLITIGLFMVASELREGEEVSVILKIPMYPLVYAVAVVALIHVLVTCCDIVRLIRGAE